MKCMKMLVVVMIVAFFSVNTMSVNAQSGWNEWVDELPTNIDNTYETEECILYRYREKSHKTSASSSMEGWTKEKDPTTTWGDWSNWQDTAVASSTTRQVETRQAGTGTYTYLDNPGLPDAVNPAGGRILYVVNSGSLLYGGDVYWVQKFLFDIRHAISHEQIDSYYGNTTANAVRGFQSDYGLSVDGKVGSETASKMMEVWRDATKTENIKTQYRYKDATVTYYYYKWSDWSEWSLERPITKEDREIETKKQYRYRKLTFDMTGVEISGLESKYTFNGEQIIPEVKLSKNEVMLYEGKDYTAEYEDNINVGTAKVIYTGIDKYVGTVEKSFSIDPEDIKKAQVIFDQNDLVYSGNDRTPSVTVKLGDKELVKDTDYIVEYNNAGTTECMVKGIGNYTGEKIITFIIGVQDNPTTQQTNMQLLTTEASTTETLTDDQEKVQIGKASIVPMDEQEEVKTASENGGADSGVKIKNEKGFTTTSNNKVSKGTIFESKKATYKVTDAKKKTVLYLSSKGKGKTEVKIPDTIRFDKKAYKVTGIASETFKNNKKIKKLVIGKNVKRIGEKAFKGCKNLKSVTFGNNVESIGAYAFYGDRKLSTIKLGTRKLNKVGKCAFKKINKHPRIIVPKEKLVKYQRMIKRAL